MNEAFAPGGTWLCKEHGVEVKACPHAVTAGYLEASKERFEFHTSRWILAEDLGTRRFYALSLLFLCRALRRKLRKH
jgi:hypothetical protein